MVLSISSGQVLNQDAVLFALEKSLAIIEFDPYGDVLWANENFAKTMGYSVDELKTMHHRELCPIDFVQSRDYEHFWTELRSKNTYQEKIQRVTKLGDTIWLEATYTPVLNDHGNVEAIIKVATDITARENGVSKMTHELKETSEHLKERASEGINRSNEVVSAINQVVEQTSENMETLQKLTTQTESIREIVKTISNIATQTNLIALNAGIQAAHAGEHGRAFDVVAKEVRKLASQSKKSTEKIHAEAEDIIEQVRNISNGTTESEKTINKSNERIEQALYEFRSIDEAAKVLDVQAEKLVTELQG